MAEVESFRSAGGYGRCSISKANADSNTPFCPESTSLACMRADKCPQGEATPAWHLGFNTDGCTCRHGGSYQQANPQRDAPVAALQCLDPHDLNALCKILQSVVSAAATLRQPHLCHRQLDGPACRSLSRAASLQCQIGARYPLTTSKRASSFQAHFEQRGKIFHMLSYPKAVLRCLHRPWVFVYAAQWSCDRQLRAALGWLLCDVFRCSPCGQHTAVTEWG